jgi:hypothetical protein
MMNMAGDFKSAVEMMGFTACNEVTAQIEDKSIPRPHIRRLLRSGELPSAEKTPEDLRWVARGEDVGQQNKQEADVGLLDTLGIYDPGRRRIVLYDPLISLVALRRGWDSHALRRVVYWHELSHGASHLGIDRDGLIWESFEYADTDLLEHYAQLYAYHALVTRGEEETVRIMRELSEGQPRCYRSYLDDTHLCLGETNQRLYHARRAAPSSFPLHDEAFGACWGLEFDNRYEAPFIGYYLMLPGTKPPEGKKGGSQFTVRGRSIEIRSHDYSPNTKTLSPRASYEVFLAIISDLAKCSSESCTPAPQAPSFRCWRGAVEGVYALKSEAGRALWGKVCDAIAVDMPTFASILQRYSADANRT